METVLRIATIYFVILIALRALGKRSFSQLSPFDLVTLLLIPEIVQQSMMREDFSMTNALIALSTLFTLVFLTSLLSHRFKKIETVIEGSPSVLVSHGQFVVDTMNDTRITPSELYGEMHKSGLSHLEQIRWAILESDGRISFIPYERNEVTVQHPDDKKLA